MKHTQSQQAFSLGNLPWGLIIVLACFGALKVFFEVLGAHQLEGVIWLLIILTWVVVASTTHIRRPFIVLLATGAVCGLSLRASNRSPGWGIGITLCQYLLTTTIITCRSILLSTTVA